MQNVKRSRWLTRAAAASAALLVASAASAQMHDFSGKSIKVIVNFPAGGSSDILMRQIAPVIGARLPGSPTLVVENRPGAGGLIGSNYLFNQVKPDGLTWGFLTGIAPLGLIGAPRAKYDPAKFKWLGALPQTQVMVVRNDLNLITPKDLARPDLQIVHAITGPNSAGTILSSLFYAMSGTKHRFVSGYRGQADTDLAIQRGEVNAADMGITIYLANAERMRHGKEISGFLQRGVLQLDGSFTRHRLLPDLPTMPEVLEVLRPEAKKSVEYRAYSVVAGTFGVQFGLMLPPGAKDDLVQTLRTAIATALNDPKARETVSKAIGFDYDFIDGAASEALLASLSGRVNKDADVKTMLTKMFATK